MNLASLTFYGGFKTIGGNCVIVEEGGSRLMLDNGMCFSSEGTYYKDFLNARTGNDLRDYLALNLVPQIAGIYGKEVLVDPLRDKIPSEGHYMVDVTLESYQDYKERTKKPYIDAILLSHAHLDHLRNIAFMSPEIPVYCSQITADILKIMESFPKGRAYLNYEYYEEGELKSGRFKGTHKKVKKRIPRKFEILEPNSEKKIGNFKIMGFSVDHSLAGATAFKITTPNGKVIVYTGDIRFHGHTHESKVSNDFVNIISSSPVDALMCEGTRINDDKKSSEELVFKGVMGILQKDSSLSEKLVFTSFPWKSITRFLTVLKVARELGRTLIIQPKLALLLHHLQDYKSLNIVDVLRNDDICIYLPRKQSMSYSEGDYSKSKQCIAHCLKGEVRSKKWEEFKQFLYSTTYRDDISIKAYEIHESPNDYVLHLEFYDLNELIDILPPENSYFFNLRTEPYDEEGMIEKNVLQNWMDRFKLDFRAGIHASGHASRSDLISMIKKINPKKVFPIHTEHPEAFNMKNVVKGLEMGQSYKI